MFRRALLPCALILFSCERDQLQDLGGFEPPERFRLDAGGVPEAPPVTADAGSVAPPVDQDPEDTTCACPSYSGICEQPAIDRPFFTPEDLRALGQLFNLIACATDRIRLAMYDTDLDCAVDALLDRLDAEPTLTVEAVIDDDRCPVLADGRRECAIARLEDHPRATVVDDARSRYMHHKFAVIDGAFLWSSSANLTMRSLCVDKNDALVIDQPEIVSAYDAELERLYEGRAFAPRAPEPPVAGGAYRVYFGPQSPLSATPTWHQAIIDAIDAATTSIDLMIFAWTKTDLSDALLRASARGVIVRGIVSPRYVHEAPTEALMAAGIPVRTASVHTKLIVVDGARVVTGTPNWSANAWANNEASLWIEDAVMAATYRDRFEVVFAEARDP